MSWKNIEEKPEEWDVVLQNNTPASGAFLQSFEWGVFQENYGRKVIRSIFVDDQNKTVAVIQAIKMMLPLCRSYLNVFRGPVGLVEAEDIKTWSQTMAKPSIFIHWEFSDLIGSPERHLGKKTKAIQPNDTHITDLNLSEEELLAGMHQKTRYNIRLAEKKGVQVSTEDKVSNDIWALFSETSNRGDFALHSRSYYESMLKTLSNGVCVAKMWVARVNGQARAAIITIDAYGIRTYLHGASSREDREYMAPFLLHWEAIKEAKNKGFKAYDWWGIAPIDAPEDHPWTGITRFKTGFPGQRFSYVESTVQNLRPLWCSIYKLAKKIKK